MAGGADTSAAVDESLQQYRSLLIAAAQKSQEDYDKTVLALSGGALGISFAFVKDIVGPRPLVHPHLLLLAWVVWGVSVACVLGSFYFSNLAFRHAIAQVDAGTIYAQPPGGSSRRLTAVLNAFGGLLFLIGVLLIVGFAFYNLR